MALFTGLIAAVFAIAFVPTSIWLGRRFGVLDTPDPRKVHRVPTPRVGGIGIFASVALAVTSVLAFRAFFGEPVSRETLRSLLAIGGAGGFIFLVGLVDDIRGVSSRFKLVVLIGAAMTVCGSGVVVSGLVFGGQTLVEFDWAGWLVTVVWIIGVAVAISFIDGLDGLAGGFVLLSSSVLCLLLLNSGSSDAAILPLALAGSLAGFLVYNWHPAKTFMGDCGSMTIGFLLACSIALANSEIGTMRGMVLPTLAISIPLLEAVLTVFRRRYLQRRSMFSAERGHIHHRLLDRGFSHRAAVVTLLGVSVIAVAIGGIALSFSGWATLAGLSLLIPLLWGTFKLAGSVRTDEMVLALRSKRELDRTKSVYRSTFEDMQLEFDQVENFSGWWRAVCRSAERFDFVRIQIAIPAADGRTREMVWESDDEMLCGCERMSASIPIETSHPDHDSVTADIEVAGNYSLESAGERLALFARLMTECSIAEMRRREGRARVQKRLTGDKTTDPDPLAISSHPNKGAFGGMKVAIVHDFLYTYCGAERVLEQLLEVFPQSDVFALFDFLPDSQRGFLKGRPVTTSFIQRMPFAKSKHRSYLPLMPLAIEQIDVSDYDIVVSSSYVAAKGVITGPEQLHICYCHSPIRFAWDLHHEYMREAGLGFSPKGLLARWILHYMRSWDVRSSLGVDHFIANSRFVAKRIQKVYRRRATVIHPPVNTDKFFAGASDREEFYLVSGRMVPYKRTNLIVRAFREMPDRKLVVIGEGPGYEEVRELAGPNVTVMGFQEDHVLVDHMQRAKALIFAAEEDFGIVPVEAISSGTPVIAYGRGGVTETVIDGETGVLFDEQSEESLIDAVDRFEKLAEAKRFDADELHRHSLEFSEEQFRQRLTKHTRRWINTKWPKRRSEAKSQGAADRNGKQPVADTTGEYRANSIT